VIASLCRVLQFTGGQRASLRVAVAGAVFVPVMPPLPAGVLSVRMLPVLMLPVLMLPVSMFPAVMLLGAQACGMEVRLLTGARSDGRGHQHRAGRS